MKTSDKQPRKRMPLKIWLPILIAIIIIGTGTVWYFVAGPFSEKKQQIREQDTKAKQLYNEHQDCVKNLQQDFKELDENNQDIYQKAYDHCETIRKDQNKAVDEYQRLIES